VERARRAEGLNTTRLAVRPANRVQDNAGRGAVFNLESRDISPTDNGIVPATGLATPPAHPWRDSKCPQDPFLPM